MEIIILRLPFGSTVRDLEIFIEPALKVCWFINKRSLIDRLKIKVYIDRKVDGIELHGHIFTKDEHLGRQLCKKLNGKYFKNEKPVAVREYQIRSWQNDRRRPTLEKVDVLGTGSRQGERRRGKQLDEITDANANVLFIGVKNFNRKQF